MAFDGASLDVRRTPAPRNVCVVEAVRVEHLFEARRRSVVQVMAAIPHALERGRLVIASAFACSQRQAWIRTDGDGKNLQSRRRILWRHKTLRQREFVA